MFGAGQIVAFLYLMTNKPALTGALATCVIAAVVSLVVGFLRLRSLGPGTGEPAGARAAVSSDAAGGR
jgi:hypothetical protein